MSRAYFYARDTFEYFSRASDILARSLLRAGGRYYGIRARDYSAMCELVNELHNTFSFLVMCGRVYYPTIPTVPPICHNRNLGDELWGMFF